MVGILECFWYVLIYCDVINHRTVHVHVLHHQTRTESVTKPYASEFLIWNFCIPVNAYGCIRSSFVAVCIGNFEKPVSRDNSLRDFGGDASNSILVLCNVSTERMCKCSLLLLEQGTCFFVSVDTL